MNEKEQKARKTVKNYMWWSTGAGLIPFPFVGVVAVSGVQFKMPADVSKICGIEFHENRGKALLGARMGFLVPSAPIVWLGRQPAEGHPPGRPAVRNPVPGSVLRPRFPQILICLINRELSFLRGFSPAPAF